MQNLAVGKSAKNTQQTEEVRTLNNDGEKYENKELEKKAKKVENLRMRLQ